MKIKSDKNIYKVNSHKGGLYQVYDSKLGRYLTLSNRFIGAHLNYKNIKKTYFYDLIKELKEETSHLNNILVFGLGAATLQNMFLKEFTNTRITTVESDPSLVDINDYFFHKQENKAHKIVISDPFQFVKNSEHLDDFHNKFDLVIVDFNVLGQDFYSEIFLKETKNFLKKKGVFVIIFQRKNYLQNIDTLKFVEKISLYYNKVTLLYSKNSILEVFCSDI